MSYTFEYTETQKITILTREEFSGLDDEDKIEYQAGPFSKESDGNETYDLRTLLVQAFIYEVVNEADLYFIPRALEEFVKVKFRSKWEEVLSSEPSQEKKEELFWDFIYKEGDEATDGIDLYILNEVYKNDYLYEMIIKECETRRFVDEINKDWEFAEKVFSKVEVSKEIISNATFTILIWVGNQLKDSDKRLLIDQENVIQRYVFPLLELESMKICISQILNTAEIMGELKDYFNIDKDTGSNYSSIEEFKTDLDWDFIKKFMIEICDELMIKF